MQVFPPELGKPRPGICFLCEEWHSDDAKTTYIDTMRDFETGVLTNLTGRKMVCEDCVRQMAGLLGWISPTVYADLVKEYDEQYARYEALEQQLEAAEALTATNVDSLVQRVLDVVDAKHNAQVPDKAPAKRKGGASVPVEG